MATTYKNANSTVSTTYGAIPSVNYAINAGQVLTTNGMNGTSWTNSTITSSTSAQSTRFNSSNHNPIMTIPHGEEKVVLEKDAALEVKGKVMINGIDLEERLKTIEKVLAIPERDAIMEAKYPSLKKKFDDYINALEKYKTFERIKGDYD